MISGLFCVVLIVGAGVRGYTLDRKSSELNKLILYDVFGPPTNSTVLMQDSHEITDPVTESSTEMSHGDEDEPPGHLNKFILYDVFGPPKNSTVLMQDSHEITDHVTESSTEMSHADEDVHRPSEHLQTTFDASSPLSQPGNQMNTDPETRILLTSDLASGLINKSTLDDVFGPALRHPHKITDPVAESSTKMSHANKDVPSGPLNTLIYDAFGPPSKPSQQYSHAVTQPVTESSTEVYRPDENSLNKLIYDAFGPPSNPSQQYSHAVTQPVTESRTEVYRPDENSLNEIFGYPSLAESYPAISLAEIKNIFGSPPPEKTSYDTELDAANNDAEIAEFAQQLGIDPASETRFLPLARDWLTQPLPTPWQAYYDKKLQAHYYYNNETKMTQWEHPRDHVYRELLKKARDGSMHGD